MYIANFAKRDDLPALTGNTQVIEIPAGLGYLRERWYNGPCVMLCFCLSKSANLMDPLLATVLTIAVGGLLMLAYAHYCDRRDAKKDHPTQHDQAHR